VARVEVRTLTDGGQPAEETAHALADFVAAAQRTLEVAVYDFHLPPDLDEIVRGPSRGYAGSGAATHRSG
jgi:hypothetical protein